MVVMTDGVGTGGGYKVTLMTAFPFYEDDILIYRKSDRNSKILTTLNVMMKNS